ncbi:UNVERIFIED_CONTAM: diacylglycerol kinase family protein [Halobacillus marinus]|uniref:diacylglycerol kinase family protein n=1 Tax=Bacillaceae TaxID=186817 RepID=UPI0002A5205A|nr:MULTISPECIES: diacylglycerol kinase family protein [Bacillaceae]ELK45487.1 diacylglycerol kinase [Halobacillus sp. BAB-2008]QHT47195.1 diacylglycerol kinase family protein [Bacillus sp. SB49]
MSSDSKGRKKKRGIGFRYAWHGLVRVINSERNFRIHLSVASIVCIAGAVLSISALEWAVVVGIIALVMTLEMVNSAIERILDHLAPERHPAVGEVKDIAAGAVLVASAGSIVIGLIIFLPKLIPLL